MTKFDYDSEVDIAYIDLKEQEKSVESEEIEEGIVVDYNANNEIVGIEIQHFSKRFFKLMDDERFKKLVGSIPELQETV